eukprot:TRINITY_DN81129_c0_g1_i1.p1 TRINITY_DN81129_c0_g1~~TRINITY_DN81129_c0_g1_i1.p1  ORF type:complete len:281 (-),score=32.22 TRINITY_DN81129_c0_g1_i1:52-894(-)
MSLWVRGPALLAAAWPFFEDVAAETLIAPEQAVGSLPTSLVRREAGASASNTGMATLVRYTLHSKAMACGDRDGTYLWEGTDSHCRRRCSSTDGCMYFTTYRGDYCELSSSCDRLVSPRDSSAVTFASESACDGELKVSKCEHSGGDSVVSSECNDISKPCLTGNRPCFKLYDTDDTGLAGRTGAQVQVLLHFEKPTRVTRIDSLGSFKNNFTIASRSATADEDPSWSLVEGSFRSSQKGQHVGKPREGVLGTSFRITWDDSEDVKGAYWPGAKLFLKGC